MVQFATPLPSSPLRIAPLAAAPNVAATSRPQGGTAARLRSHCHGYADRAESLAPGAAPWERASVCESDGSGRDRGKTREATISIMIEEAPFDKQKPTCTTIARTRAAQNPRRRRVMPLCTRSVHKRRRVRQMTHWH